MAVIEGGVSGSLAGVGAEANNPLHVIPKALPYGSLGHYRSAVRFALIASQGANSRLWEIRNTSTNVIVPTRLRVYWTPIANHTAAVRLEIDLFKLTGFTAVDTTGTVTPTVSSKRTTMGAAPGNAAIRHVTVAGATGGMTGGTLTKDGGAVAMCEQWMQATLPTGATGAPVMYDLLEGEPGEHPFVLAQNEGLLLENIVAAGAAAGSSVVVECSWAEVTAY